MQDGQTPEQLKQLTKFVVDQLAAEMRVSSRQVYVIYNPKVKQLLHDAMTRKPVSNTNPKVLEATAKQFGGRIISLADAIKLLAPK